MLKPFCCCRHIIVADISSNEFFTNVLTLQRHQRAQLYRFFLQKQKNDSKICFPAPWKEEWTPPSSPGPSPPPPSTSTPSGSASSTASFFLLASSPRSEWVKTWVKKKHFPGCHSGGGSPKVHRHCRPCSHNRTWGDAQKYCKNLREMFLNGKLLDI